MLNLFKLIASLDMLLKVCGQLISRGCNPVEMPTDHGELRSDYNDVRVVRLWCALMSAPVTFLANSALVAMCCAIPYAFAIEQVSVAEYDCSVKAIRMQKSLNYHFLIKFVVSGRDLKSFQITGEPSPDLYYMRRACEEISCVGSSSGSSFLIHDGSGNFFSLDRATGAWRGIVGASERNENEKIFSVGNCRRMKQTGKIGDS